MKIAAFDLSLTAAGFAVATTDGTRVNSGVITPTKLIGVPRLRLLRARVLELATDADVVVIEGYSYGAKGNAILNLAELGGVARVALADETITFVDVPPACLKLFATGKGNAPKDEVLAAAIRKLEYTGHDHNEADALWLLEMGLRHYRDDVRTQTQPEGRALEKIAWPEVYACR